MGDIPVGYGRTVKVDVANAVVVAAVNAATDIPAVQGVTAPSGTVKASAL